MLKLLVLAYAFAPAQTVHYDVDVRFDGFLPVFGGRQGVVQVKMGVDATGQAPAADGAVQVVSEVKTAEILMNGAKMPLGLANVETYFPKTTLSMTPQGKMLKTDAPDIQMPFRLPGLDVKRFPDITYIPIEFPADGVEVGKSFSFKKRFGDSDVTYEVTPTRIEDGTVGLAIKLSQREEVFEDKKLQIVDEKDAASRVVTDLNGDGTATFDRTRGIVSDLDVTAEAVSHVTDLQTKVEKERRLKTRLIVKAPPVRSG